MKKSENIISLSIVAGVVGIWFIAAITGLDYFFSIANHDTFNLLIFILLPTAFFLGFFIVFIRLFFIKINAMDRALTNTKKPTNETK